MKTLNQVQLIGNVGNVPEFKNSQGKAVTHFSLATSEEWLDKATSQKRQNIEWHRLVCFNKLAEIANTYVLKGSKVYVSGKLKTSKWQSKNNETQYSTEIIVDELILLSKKNSDVEANGNHQKDESDDNGLPY